MEDTRNSFFWGEGGLLKPVTPHFSHDCFQQAEKGLSDGAVQSINHAVSWGFEDVKSNSDELEEAWIR